jgi:hypothetical protein
VSASGAYDTYTTELYYGWYQGSSMQKMLAQYQNGLYYIPANALFNAGNVYLTLRLVSGGNKVSTNTIPITIEKSAVNNEYSILPATETWQSAVDYYINNSNSYLNKRIDNLVANTGNSNSEIVDARVGYNNNTYSTLGEAIRKQFDSVDEEKQNKYLYILENKTISNDTNVFEFSDPYEGKYNKFVRIKNNGTQNGYFYTMYYISLNGVETKKTLYSSTLINAGESLTVEAKRNTTKVEIGNVNNVSNATLDIYVDAENSIDNDVLNARGLFENTYPSLKESLETQLYKIEGNFDLVFHKHFENDTNVKTFEQSFEPGDVIRIINNDYIESYFSLELFNGNTSLGNFDHLVKENEYYDQILNHKCTKITVTNKNSSLNYYIDYFKNKMSYKVIRKYHVKDSADDYPILKKFNQGDIVRITNKHTSDCYFSLQLDTTLDWVTSDVIKPNEYQDLFIKRDCNKITVKNINGSLDYYIDCLSDLKTKKREVLFCGKNREITKLSDAVKYATSKGNIDLFVDPGEYDLVDELGESGMLNNKDGLYIGNGLKIYFADGAKILCHYKGTNEELLTNFSPFVALGSDYALYNVNIEASNVRYCVHDDTYGKGTYKHEYYNCVMSIDNRNNTAWGVHQAIGGGMGENGTIIIDGGIYDSIGIDTTDNGTITYHNATDNDKAFGSVYIKNVYFKNGTCFVSSTGSSTLKSKFIVTNCSAKVAPHLNGTTNFEMYSWNNEVRNN